MTHLERIGVSVPWLLAFLAANLLSIVAVNHVIHWFYESFLSKAQPQAGDVTPNEIKKRRDELREQLGLDYGGLIGRLERVFFIYSFMTSQFGVLTAIVIFKAFFGWIRTPEMVLTSGSLRDDERAATSRHVFVLYHAYVFGNLLSLVTAMILGHGAIVLAKLLDHYI